MRTIFRSTGHRADCTQYEDTPDTIVRSLWSDEHFEAIRQTRGPLEPSPHDRRDNEAVRDKPRVTNRRPKSTIEQRFKPLADHLDSMWASTACALYLRRLLVADHGYGRALPPEVMGNVMLLDRINRSILHEKRISRGPPECEMTAFMRHGAKTTHRVSTGGLPYRLGLDANQHA
jgi:hypothetical protein